MLPVGSCQITFLWLSSAFLHLYCSLFVKISNPPKWKVLNENTDLLLAIFQILTENDDTPADCATAVVNKDLSVYLQLQGALNADAEREKLRKKKEEIQK